MIIFLQNLFNAPWPKEFNATAFESITDSKQIRNLTNEEQDLMAKKVVEDNKHLHGAKLLNNTPFWSAFVYPVWQAVQRQNRYGRQFKGNRGV